MQDLVCLDSGTANVLQTLQFFGQICVQSCPLVCACRSTISRHGGALQMHKSSLRTFVAFHSYADGTPALQTSALCQLQLMFYRQL